MAKEPAKGEQEAVDEMLDKDWEEISVDFYRFVNVGDSITGVLTSKDVTTIRDNEVGRYELEKPDHKRIAFLGGVQLDRLLDSVSVGEEIRLVFQGKVKTGGGTEVKTFKLFHKKPKAD